MNNKSPNKQMKEPVVCYCGKNKQPMVHVEDRVYCSDKDCKEPMKQKNIREEAMCYSQEQLDYIINEVIGPETPANKFESVYQAHETIVKQEQRNRWKQMKGDE